MRSILEYLVTTHTKNHVVNSGEGKSGANINRNRVVSTSGWPDSRYKVLYQFFKEYIDQNNDVLSETQLTFIKDFAKDLKAGVIKKFLNNGRIEPQYPDVNGERPNFGRAKCLYDVISWSQTNMNLTVPQSRKLEIVKKNIEEGFGDQLNKAIWPDPIK